MPHPWLPGATKEARLKMLRSIGVSDPMELFSDIPQHLVVKEKLRVGLGEPLDEARVHRIVLRKLAKNRVFTDPPPFMGGGVCYHHIPSVVLEIVSRGEFYTSYTPYQPEMSQGLLQALFEYQSLMAELLELEVVNASMYDAATALGEAMLMCVRVTGKRRVLVPGTMNPRHRRVAETYVRGKGISVEPVSFDRESGLLDLNNLEDKLRRGDVAAVYVENPSYLGFFEENVQEISELAHRYGALLIAGVEPISLALVKPPGEYEADVAVAEGQPLGLGLNFGGPLLGVLGVRWDHKLVRQLPGRLVGMTVDREGARGFALILQTREQHIRRERATSNITTNEALAAVAAAAYLSTLGKRGLRALAEEIFARATYASSKLNLIEGVKAPALGRTHWKEFTVSFAGIRYPELHKRLLAKGILGGHYVSKEMPWLKNAALFCVTEVHSKRDIDLLVESIRECVER